MKRKVTAAMAEAAIAEGVDPKNLEILSQADYDAHLAAKAEGTEDNLTPEELAAKAEADEQATKDAAENEGELSENEIALSENEIALAAQVEALTEELSTANASTEALTTQVVDLTAQVEASMSDPLRVIALDRLSVMRVALGLSTVDMKNFPTTSLLTEYHAVEDQFKTVYKSGGHAPTKKGVVEETPAKVKLTLFDSAKFSAVG